MYLVIKKATFKLIKKYVKELEIKLVKLNLPKYNTPKTIQQV